MKRRRLLSMILAVLLTVSILPASFMNAPSHAEAPMAASWPPGRTIRSAISRPACKGLTPDMYAAVIEDPAVADAEQKVTVTLYSADNSVPSVTDNIPNKRGLLQTRKMLLLCVKDIAFGRRGEREEIVPPALFFP